MKFGWIKIGLFCKATMETPFSHQTSHMINKQMLPPVQPTKKKTRSSLRIMVQHFHWQCFAHICYGNAAITDFQTLAETRERWLVDKIDLTHVGLPPISQNERNSHQFIRAALLTMLPFSCSMCPRQAVSLFVSHREVRAKVNVSCCFTGGLYQCLCWRVQLG